MSTMASPMGEFKIFMSYRGEDSADVTGRMYDRLSSPDPWLRWGHLHADHHLRQFGS